MADYKIFFSRYHTSEKHILDFIHNLMPKDCCGMPHDHHATCFSVKCEFWTELMFCVRFFVFFLQGANSVQHSHDTLKQAACWSHIIAIVSVVSIRCFSEISGNKYLDNWSFGINPKKDNLRIQLEAKINLGTSLGTRLFIHIFRALLDTNGWWFAVLVIYVPQCAAPPKVRRCFSNEDPHCCVK